MPSRVAQKWGTGVESSKSTDSGLPCPAQLSCVKAPSQVGLACSRGGPSQVTVSGSDDDSVLAWEELSTDSGR